MKYWTDHQKQYVFDNISKMTLSDIAKHLGKSENSLNIFIHRHRNNEHILLKPSILRRILDKKFVKAEYFNPTRTFFEKVKIGQKRFWAIYRGDTALKDEELVRIASYLEIDFEIIYEIRQLSLFEKNNE